MRLFEPSAAEPVVYPTRTLHPDYGRWPVTVAEAIGHHRGPPVTSAELCALIVRCLEAWGVRNAKASDEVVFDDRERPEMDRFRYVVAGDALGRTAAEANEALRRAVWAAVETLEADWERIDAMRDVSRYQPPKAAP